MSISNPSFSPSPYRPINPSSIEIKRENKGNLVINNEGNNLIIIEDSARKVIPLGKDIRLSDKDIAEIGRTFKTKLFKYFDTLEDPKGDIRNRLIEKCRQLSLRHDSSSTTTSSSSSTSFSTSSNDLTGTTQIAKNILTSSSSSTVSLTNDALKQKSLQIQQLLTEIKTYLLDNAHTLEVPWILHNLGDLFNELEPKFEFDYPLMKIPPEPGEPAFESHNFKFISALLKHPFFKSLMDYMPPSLEVADSLEECLRVLKDGLASSKNATSYLLILLNLSSCLQMPPAEALEAINNYKNKLKNEFSRINSDH